MGRTGHSRPRPGEDFEAWRVDVSVADGDGLEVGDEVEFAKTVHDGDVHRFAMATGDTNPLHLDEAYADATQFDGRVAHGVLTSGLVSAGLARLPGVVTLLSLEQEYRAPVELDDRLTAVLEVAEALGADRYRINTMVRKADGTICLQGEATVIVGESPNTR